MIFQKAVNFFSKVKPQGSFGSGALPVSRIDSLTKPSVRIAERFIEGLIYFAGISSILIISLIFIFLFKEALGFFKTAPWTYTIGRTVYDAWEEKDVFNMLWQPVGDVPKYSFVPIFLGSILVALPATLMATVFGVGCAIYLSEIAPPRLREILKPTLELLAGIPTVVIGFLMLVLVASPLQDMLGTKFRLNAFVGAIGVALTTMPIIITLAEDALQAVPRELRNASFALGGTRWQTILGTVLPTAVSGVSAAVILGFGRALGETMIVLMATGNAAIITLNPFSSVRTMTATIASELGEVSQGDEHYTVLFLVGIFLFILTFILNMLSEIVVSRMRKQLRM
ncbi:MAG: phosphate ABC transporter permease subunit PstC [Candidatus Omnitrophica bacterium]|nr:phosphate ABC transporter permease subunit PstC [Candidatus Omnitrophota bacterium]